MLSNQSQDFTAVFNTTIFWDIDGTLFRTKLSNETPRAFNNAPLAELLRDNAQGRRLKALMQQINNDLCRSRLNNFHACLTAKNKADAYTDYLAENFEDFFYSLNPEKNKKIKAVSSKNSVHYYVTKQLQTIRIRPLGEPEEAILENSTHFITPFIIANNLCANKHSTLHQQMSADYPAIYYDKILWSHAQNKLSGLLKTCEMEAYCQKTGTHPNCLILVDDAIEVIQAAQQYGFIAIHFSQNKSFDQLETELLAAVEQIKTNALANKHQPYTSPSDENPPKLTEETTMKIQLTLMKTIADDIMQNLKLSKNNSSLHHTPAIDNNTKPDNTADLPPSKKARNAS